MDSDKTSYTDLPKAAIEYIDVVIKKMRYRRKVRADVRAELVAHFEDALRDCDSDDEKAKLTAALIAKFGEPKILAKLIRRSKKRCRPLWQTMIARAFQLIGICFVLLLLYIGWFLTGKPVVTTDYLEIVNQQVRPTADDRQNAWPLYNEAVEDFITDEKTDIDKPRSLSGLSEQERQWLEEWLSKSVRARELIRQGNEKPYYWKEYKGYDDDESTELISVVLPNTGGYRLLVRLMCWQALLDAENKEFDKAFENIFEAYIFGQHLRGQTFSLIEQLVAMRMEAFATQTLRIILYEHSHEIDAVLVDTVRKKLSDMIEQGEYTLGFKGEKLFMYDEMQRCFTQSRIGKSHIYLQRILQVGHMVGPNNYDEDKMLKSWLHILFTHPDRDETLQAVNEYYEKVGKIVYETPASRQNMDNFFDAFNIEHKNNYVLAVLGSAHDRCIMMSYRSRVDSEATLTILAILQYQKQYGKLPETLNVLVEKNLLKKVSIDPFSDEPLIYKKTEAGFTLYSVGENYIDDRLMVGDTKKSETLWTKDGDAVFWPVEAYQQREKRDKREKEQGRSKKKKKKVSK